MKTDRVLQGIRITRKKADEIFPFAIQPYWQKIADRFPPLRATDLPGTVSTSLLSLAYNRGANNPALEPLGEPLATGEWETVADIIGNMQQNHKLLGIRIRRQYEAELIKAEFAI